MENRPKIPPEIKQKYDQFRIEKITKHGPHQAVWGGGSNEPAVHSQNSAWGPCAPQTAPEHLQEGPRTNTIDLFADFHQLLCHLG